jgi:hypothetical protein
MFLILLQIELQPSEVLMEICGIVGPYVNLSPSNVIKSLTFITNEDRYTFGHGGEGHPFHTPVKDNYIIIGLFGRASKYVHAIGVYMNPIHPNPAGEKVITWQREEEEE